MLNRELLSRKFRFTFAFSSILLGCIISPCWAMDDKDDQKSFTTPHNSSEKNLTDFYSHFDYNHNYIQEASTLIRDAKFLPEAVRTFFESGARDFDRTQFRGKLGVEKKETYSYLGIETSLRVLDSNTGRRIKGKFLPDDILLGLAKGFKNRRALVYDKALKDLEYSISTRGEKDTDFLNSFFSHLLGIGKVFYLNHDKINPMDHSFFYYLSGIGSPESNQTEEEKQNIYIYPQDKVKELFIQLQESKFLKNFNIESLPTYNPSQQLRVFKANTKEITDLVIAGGHIGNGIMSVSPYKNTLTIDLNPLVFPDIIADINNKDFLNTLSECYKGYLKNIYETSNFSNTFSLLEEETMKCLIGLLCPGGRLNIATMVCGNQIETNTANNLAQKYQLKLIYSEQFSDMIIALEK